jgi:hypothetical protein
MKIRPAVWLATFKLFLRANAMEMPKCKDENKKFKRITVSMKPICYLACPINFDSHFTYHTFISNKIWIHEILTVDYYKILIYRRGSGKTE